VEPAGGVRLELSAISANAPEGWKLDNLATDYQISATHPEVVTLLFLLQVPDPTDGEGGVEQTAKDVLRVSGWLQKPKILEPTEIDGVEVYHIAGRIDSSSFVEEFGTTVDGQLVRVSLQMTEIMSKKERRELVESVLQTVEIGA
jgi:single-stranded DNA-binding protein